VPGVASLPGVQSLRAWLSVGANTTCRLYWWSAACRPRGGCAALPSLLSSRHAYLQSMRACTEVMESVGRRASSSVICLPRVFCMCTWALVGCAAVCVARGCTCAVACLRACAALCWQRAVPQAAMWRPAPLVCAQGGRCAPRARRRPPAGAHGKCLKCMCVRGQSSLLVFCWRHSVNDGVPGGCGLGDRAPGWLHNASFIGPVNECGAASAAHAVRCCAALTTTGWPMDEAEVPCRTVRGLDVRRQH
jgi:hypothetical protein